MAEKKYKDASYVSWLDPSRRSAEVVVPIAIELIRPGSVVDVGCGLGMWARTFSDCGVETAHGIDGSSVPTDELLIPRADFIAVDLSLGVHLSRQYDLVVSLEVGEHLPSSSAEAFVGSLTALGPVVLFSAAVPQQGGAHHINEQWPEYWARQFAKKGYRAVDAMRRRIWNDEKVAPYYCQNIIVYVKEDRLEEYPALLDDALPLGELPPSLIHPHYYLSRTGYKSSSLKWWGERLRYYFFAVLRRVGLRFGS